MSNGTKSTSITDWLMVVVTTAAALFACGSAYYAYKAWEQLVEDGKIAKRAYVGPTEYGIEENGKFIPSLKLRNSGLTPANRVQIFAVECPFASSDNPSVHASCKCNSENGNGEINQSNGLLLPGAEITLRFLNFCITDNAGKYLPGKENAIGTEQREVWLSGHVKYQDIYQLNRGTTDESTTGNNNNNNNNGPKWHTTKFCVLYAPGAHQFFPSKCPPGSNSAD